jgi:carboxyl-terminal processing protease
MTVRSGTAEMPGSERIVTMQRSLLEVQNPVSYKLSEIRRDGTKVGYVKLLEFNALVKGRLEDALADLEAQGVNAYVLDIRQNTGGAFQSAVEIAGLFAEDKVATYAVDSSGTRLAFRTPKGKLAVDKIDGRSASASEVLAASLRDNCRGSIMGQQSYGKGLIQAVYGLKNGAGLVLTVARYETPAGNDIQGVGIKPDFGNEFLPFGPFGLGTDTSKVDFVIAKERLTPPLCRIPTS